MPYFKSIVSHIKNKNKNKDKNKTNFISYKYQKNDIKIINITK